MTYIWRAMRNIVINDTTNVFLDPRDDDHIVVRFVGERDVTLPRDEDEWEIAVRRARHATAFVNAPLLETSGMSTKKGDNGVRQDR
jgi:hypothetical protein